MLRVLPCLDVIHRIHKFNLDAGGKLKAGSHKSKGGGVSRSLATAAVVSDPFPISVLDFLAVLVQKYKY